jgi:fused signal recognition particle receptor
LSAADTFRAAAIDQLEIWANRVGVEIIKHQPGADPGAVVFDSIQAAIARGADVVLVDTAGRLHTKSNLMEELRKVGRIVNKALGRDPEETLLVLDATTGQNAVTQAKEFQAIVPLTGIALAKIDGTAKGGIVVTIKDELGLPIKLAGSGEGIDDLEDFSPQAFVDALFEG